MWKVNGRTITDDYIIRVETWAGAKKVVAKLNTLGYSFAASVEKYNCYYVARSVVFDDGSEPTRKTINWGRSEVEDSDEFDKMQTYEEFMGEPEPEDEPIIKTATIRVDNVKDSDGWYSLAHTLGYSSEEISDIFKYGEFADFTIEVDKDLNIVGGKIHRHKES